MRFNYPLKNVKQPAFRRTAIEHMPEGSVLRLGGTAVTRISYTGLGKEDIEHLQDLQRLKGCKFILTVGYQHPNEFALAEYRKLTDAGIEPIAVQMHNENWLNVYNLHEIPPTVAGNELRKWLDLRNDMTTPMYPSRYMARALELMTMFDSLGYAGNYIVNVGMYTDQDGRATKNRLRKYADGVFQALEGRDLSRVWISTHSYPRQESFTLKEFQAQRAGYGLDKTPMHVTEAAYDWTTYTKTFETDRARAYEMVSNGLASLGRELLPIDVVYQHCGFHKDGLGAIDVNGPTPIFDAQIRPVEPPKPTINYLGYMKVKRWAWFSWWAHVYEVLVDGQVNRIESSKQLTDEEIWNRIK